MGIVSYNKEHLCGLESYLDTAGVESSSEQANVEEDEVLSQLYSTKVRSM